MDTAAFMKDFFERYYKKLSKEYRGAPELPDVPKEMWTDGADPKSEWKPWKLIPATISDQEIEELERDLGVKLPDIMKIFLTTYFHLFDDPVGRNSSRDHFEGIKDAWNPLLVKAGYLPFAWDEDCYIRCFDLANMPDEDHCEICQIDHEVLFGFDEGPEVSREKIEKEMKVIANNFIEYLEKL